MPSEDRIEIKDLLLRCIIGINESERENKQDVLINVALLGDFSQAGASDDIHDTVNYRALTKEIVAAVESSKFFLVEKLGEQIAEICLRDEQVRRVQVSVEKPGALRFARSVGIQIERERREKKS